MAIPCEAIDRCGADAGANRSDRLLIAVRLLRLHQGQTGFLEVTMDGFVTNIERDSIRNADFRRVLYTGPNAQLVIMTLRPREEIGAETHPRHDQFIRVEQGSGVVRINGEERVLHDGSAVVIPAGAKHNVVNTSTQAPLRLYTLYSPPEHPDGTVHRTKQDAIAAEAKSKAEGKTVLQPGRDAPDFTLPDEKGRHVSLRDFRGRAVVLAFFPGDWNPVCGDQLALYNELVPDFKDMDAELLGISVDSVWSHQAYAQNRNLHFPLLSDFQPRGAVSRKYHAFREDDGTCERALFVVDRDGVIAWSHLSAVDVNPGADGIVGALSKLKAPARKRVSKEAPATPRAPASGSDEARP
jgi:peroxiredoxin/mannose-6-phosphate isomerase-like protein (cupin superfamily)